MMLAPVPTWARVEMLANAEAGAHVGRGANREQRPGGDDRATRGVPHIRRVDSRVGLGRRRPA